MTEPANDPKSSSELGKEAKDALVRLATAILKEVGVTTFVVLFLAFFLLTFSTSAQKQKFIDIWFLLETSRHEICVIVIIGIACISVIGAIYYRTMLKMSRMENKRVGEEKSRLQEILVASGKLSTSTEP